MARVTENKIVMVLAGIATIVVGVFTITGIVMSFIRQEFVEVKEDIKGIEHRVIYVERLLIEGGCVKSTQGDDSESGVSSEPMAASQYSSYEGRLR